MASELIVYGALANCGPDAPTDEFLALLAGMAPDVAVFRYRPIPKSELKIKSVADWQAILGTGADLIAFAGLIWAAYERWVRPKIEEKKHKPFLFINLKRPDGTFVQFSLGHEHKDKEMFIEQFRREVSVLRSAPGVGGDDETVLLKKISEHEDWVRVHVRDKDS